MSGRRDVTPRRALRWAVAAAVWAAAFGGVHLHWALGGRFGLADPLAADEAFGRAWFQAYNLAVAAASLALAAGVVLLVAPRRLRALRAAVAVTAALLLLRGAIGAVELLVVLAGAHAVPAAEAWAWWPDLSMLLGGVLLLGTLRQARPTQP